MSIDAVAASISSYTDLKTCRPLARLVLPERQLGAEEGSRLRRCLGPKGISAVIVDDGERSWLVLEAAGTLYPLSRAMVETFSLGNFPAVAEPGKLEWRSDAKGSVVGLIVRVRYQRRDVPATAPSSNASTLMAFRIRPGSEPELAGVSTDNVQARALIDAGH
ncbi:hypothetical protein [Bosea sp. LjRoot237]|uniref:hypothetical protein n=1 Tax=Bosea sp. LjRoot237 TaxID=3342292 RepID=UPI003ED16F38